jgi:signal transduction histidine kinase
MPLRAQAPPALVEPSDDVIRTESEGNRETRRDTLGLAWPAALGTAVLFYASWQILGWIPGDPATVGDILFVPMTVGALYAACSASRGAPRGTARAWRLVAGALCGQLLGGLVSLYYEAILHQSPYPSLADPLYLSFYPLMLAGLLTMCPADRRPSRRLRLSLDLAITALGGAAVVWYVVLGPTAEAGGQGALQMAFSIAYPVGDMILIVGLASLLLRGVTGSTRRALWLLAGGLSLFVVGDVLYGYATLHGGFGSGDALNSTYFVAFGLFALAGRRQRLATTDPVTSSAESTVRVSWMPYLGVASGFAVLVVSESNHQLFPDGCLASAATVLAGLVSTRQLLTQRELIGARRQLESAHAHLARALEAERAAAVERERMELELRLAQKLEAVGQLAAGIAHEINTPIQFIGDTGRFLDEAFDDLLPVLDAYAEIREAARSGVVPVELLDRVQAAEQDADVEYLRERVPGALARISDGVSRVATIVAAMRAFAHPSTEKAAVDINESIRTTLIVAANEYKYVADVKTEFGPVPAVVCSVGDLNQVLLSLIVNAAHAIADAQRNSEDRGVIEIKTRRRDEEVVISVADSGCGIPPEVAGRVFDPFFTTKDVGRGMGQGLAVARAIVVDRHAGVLSFAPKPGGGTTFTIRLPLTNASNTAVFA